MVYEIVIHQCQLLSPATKLRQSNVFTPVFHPVHREGSATHPHPQQTPPCPVHGGIRSTSGRYASYWNAFLFMLNNLFKYPCRFKNVLFEISATESVGIFDVSAKFMGVAMEKVELIFQVDFYKMLLI